MMFRGLSNDRRQMAWNSTADCSRSRSLGLVRSQRRLCQNHLDMMPSVVSASSDTVDLCQDLFADRRWNCSTIQRAPNFLPDLTGSTFPIILYTPTIRHDTTSAVVLSFVGFMSSSFRIATTAEIENKLVKPRIARAVERGCKLKKLKKTLKVQILDVF